MFAFEILKVLYAITVFQLLFFSLVVLVIKPAKKYQYWLAVFLFIEFFTLFLHLGRWLYYFIPDGHLYVLFSFLFEYSLCPAFLLFVIKVSNYKLKFTKSVFLLVLPYIIGFSFIYIPQPLWIEYGLLFHIILSINYYGQAIIYAILAQRIYKKFQANMANFVTQNYIQQLNWLRLVILGFIVLLVFGFTYNLLGLFILKTYTSTNIAIEIVKLLAINIMLFVGATKPIGLGIVVQESSQADSVNYKYASSSLSLSDKENIISKLEEIMNSNKLYKTPNITLKNVADEIDVQNKHLSQVINEKFKMNFCEYINTLRIEDAKEQLSDSKNGYKTILEIIYDTGFNSKSVFNTIFKKQTGVTPSAFRLAQMNKLKIVV